MAAWNPRANEVFVNALERSAAEERAAYLDSVCGSDDPLRRQVEALLAAHAQAGSFLGSPAAGPGGACSPSGEPAQPATVSCGDSPEGVGTVLAGRYKLIEVIGDG